MQTGWFIIVQVWGSLIHILLSFHQPTYRPIYGTFHVNTDIKVRFWVLLGKVNVITVVPHFLDKSRLVDQGILTNKKFQEHLKLSNLHQHDGLKFFFCSSIKEKMTKTNNIRKLNNNWNLGVGSLFWILLETQVLLAFGQKGPSCGEYGSVFHYFRQSKFWVDF